MKFDPRKARNQRSASRGEWDLRNFKVRKSFLGNQKLKITTQILDIFGEEIVKGIQYEAAKAARISSAIPSTRKFIKSFYYEITEKGSLKITSTWPWVKKYLNRKYDYPMKWLTRARGAKRVIALRSKNGNVIFRNAPLRLNQAWVHPSVARFDFIEKGIQRGKDKALLRIRQMGAMNLLGND
jgi:hypothetical protein